MSDKETIISCVRLKPPCSVEDQDKICTAIDVKTVVFPKTNEKYTFGIKKINILLEHIFDEN